MLIWLLLVLMSCKELAIVIVIAAVRGVIPSVLLASIVKAGKLLNLVPRSMAPPRLLNVLISPTLAPS